MTVSVVVPAYNCAAYIGRTLESLLSQSYRDLEIVVVDDGSGDATRQIALDAAARDDRVVVISQAPSGKAAAARNTGIRASRGEFVSFLDADDLFHADKIRIQLDAFSRLPDLGLVFCDIAKFTDEGALLSQPGYLEGLDFLNVASSHLQRVEGDLYACDDRFYNFMSARITSMTTCTVMVRRSLLDREPRWFNEDLDIGEDVDLWFRLGLYCRAGFVPRVLSYYRQRPGSLSSDSGRVMRGTIAAHSANLERGRSRLTPEEISVIEKRLARQYCLLGHHLVLDGDHPAAREAYHRCRSLDSAQFPLAAYAKTFVPRPLLKLSRSVRTLAAGRRTPSA